MVSQCIRYVSRIAASTQAVVCAFALFSAWLIAGFATHFGDVWINVANVASNVVAFLLLFILAAAQDRDTKAISVKLDAVILAIDAADNRLVAIEDKTSEEVAALSGEIRAAV